jgi:hypothetical protein
MELARVALSPASQCVKTHVVLGGVISYQVNALRVKG